MSDQPDSRRPRSGPPRLDGAPAAGSQRPPQPPAEGEALAVVRFKDHRKSCFHNRRRLELRVGQYCLVEADRGRDLGRIAYLGPGTADWWDEAVYQGVLAIAQPGDLARLPELRSEENQAWDIAREKIQEHGLAMHLVGCERRWDRGKLTFYFLADERIDFRALVRDLAGIFRTRIELRQIGVRDETKLKGGLGICGREFCCASFLVDFASVALRMAKDQQLPLNPAKLSGPCGRLRCCLAYEHQAYQDVLSTLPRLGSEVTWRGREGKARKLDPLRASVTVQFFDGDGELVEVPGAQLTFARAAYEAVESERPAAGGDDGGSDGRGRRPRRRGGRRRSGARSPGGSDQ
ncbi:MAG TPA: stage 0 sporulation family protein [Candidatus Krumholzibacteria bacterium]|nr:stage 0 sporulation family protein [Candidatus Krumholzibacteria bacterium]HPD72326.1 stage 0 sporulation family protein [Candidatus Krumholzibacteria bacterium]HRY40742.1 stage 0 sporulation family protein [Candidatus Krumholzibacteria bacterium]